MKSNILFIVLEFTLLAFINFLQLLDIDFRIR